MATVDVTDFGADPSGVRDSASAVAAAIASVGAGDAVIRFPRGRYAFGPDGSAVRELYVSNTVGADPRYRDKRIGVLLEGLRDVVIDGDGSLFVFHGTQTTFGILDCERVTVRDVEVDFARPTVIDVTVVAAGVDGGRAFRELTVPSVSEYRVDGTSVIWLGEERADGSRQWSGADGLDYCQMLDPRTGRTVRVDDPVWRDVVSLDAHPGGLRVTYRHADDPDDVGAVYQYRRTVRDHPGVAVVASASVVFERVAFRFLHGFGLVAQHGRDLTLTDCVFQPPAGSGRQTAGFADFVQCSGMSGHIRLTGCVFDGAHDDPVNVHGTYPQVDAIEGDVLHLRFMHPETAGIPLFEVGDELEIVPADTLVAALAPFRVVEVDQPSGRDHDRPLDTMRVRVDRPVPVAVPAAAGGDAVSAGARHVVENITRTPALTVTGCTFRAVPTRGVLVSTRGPVRITGSTFERLPMPSIFISADASGWFESGPVRDVVISGNRFVEPGDAAVAVEPSVSPDGPAVHGSVRLAGNHVEASGDVVILRARGLASYDVSDTTTSPGVRARLDVRPPAPDPAIPSPRHPTA